MTSIVIVAFYKFVDLPDYQTLRRSWQDFCREQDVKGSILLAAEGVNGTIAGARGNVDAVLSMIRADRRLVDLTHKESFSTDPPFRRMKVRLKKEIVNLGVPGIDPTSEVGTYIPAAEWNDLISDPDTLLIDTRNEYEVALGTFRGAVNPDIKAFNQFPEYVDTNLDPQKHPRVAMFCTGGIRCEKATAYLMQKGFKEVFHLRDGILKYLAEINAEESLWEGDCFVFDERVAVNHQLQPAAAELCPTCQTPLTEELKSAGQYKAGLYCPNCYHTKTAAQIASFEERQKQRRLAARQGNK